MEPRQNPMWTIGHSNMSLPAFLSLLNKHAIEQVLDVRSQPYSRAFPYFNQEPLSRALQNHDIRYAHLGRQLGGRPTADRLYDPAGRADYRKMAKEQGFQSAIKAIQARLPERRMVLLCTEHDPAKCHRTLLVGQALHKLEIPVVHILRTGETVSHTEVVEQLTRLHSRKQGVTRPSENTGIEDAAVDAQARTAAYRKKKHR